jgi:hypothetical protein
MPQTQFTLDSLPDELREALRNFSVANPDWPIARVMCAALSLFLVQNGVENSAINRLYLDTTFSWQVKSGK